MMSLPKNRRAVRLSLISIAGYALLAVGLRPHTFGAEAPAYIKNESSVDLRTFGLAFQAPDSWGRGPELAYAQLARFVRIEDGKAVGLLEVQTAPGKGRTPQAVAAAIASERNGTVAEKGTVSSEPAGTVEVSVKPTDPFRFARAAVFPVRDQFVIVQVEASSPDELALVFKKVMGSMIEKPMTPAVDDLGVERKRPIALFDSAVLLPLPEPFRPDKVKDQSREMFFGVRDWSTGHDEVSLQIQVLPNAGHKSVKDVTDVTSKTLSAKLGTPIRFTKANSDPESYISNSFPPADKYLQRIVQMRLDDDRLAVLIFRSTAPDPKRARYMDAAEQIIKAARTSAAYQAGRKEGERSSGK